MAGGRCAGCGKQSASCKVVASHTQQCPEFLRLWREAPGLALDPASELRRWKAEQQTQEAKTAKEMAKAEKAANLREFMMELGGKRNDIQRSRWAGRRKYIGGTPTAAPTGAHLVNRGRTAAQRELISTISTRAGA